VLLPSDNANSVRLRSQHDSEYFPSISPTFPEYKLRRTSSSGIVNAAIETRNSPSTEIEATSQGRSSGAQHEEASFRRRLRPPTPAQRYVLLVLVDFTTFSLLFLGDYI
jgi:hypothetical protein